MFWKSKTKNSGMYNTLSIPANLISWTQSGTNWNGVLTEATMLANNIDYTRVMNVVPQWSQATNGNGWVTTISRSSNDNNIYITLTRGGGSGSVDTTNLVTTNTQQTITGDKQFNGNVEFNKYVVVHNGSDNDCGLAFHRDAQHANYAGFYNGNTRLGFIGKASANDTSLTLKAETGDLVLDCGSDTQSINASGKNISNVKNPTNAQHAATKAYVDNKAGDWIQIGTINSATSGLNSSSFVDQTVTNVPENFTLENQSKYEVLLKINVDSSDIFNSTVIGVNSNTYNNVGMFTIPWGNSLLWVYLTIKNGSVSAKYMLRQSGTNWNTPITIFMRKVG